MEWFLWRVDTGAAARKTSEWKFFAVAAMGALIVGRGIVWDKWMCLLFGSNFSLLFWAFFGCKVTVFVAFLIVLLLALEQGKNHNPKL